MAKNSAGNGIVTVYRPNQRHDLGFFQVWEVMARNIVNSRELIWQLFRRDFLAAYKKSFIGVAWILLAPIMGIVSWVYLNSTGMLRPGDVGVPYPVYVLVGSTVWGLFVSFFDAAQSTLTEGRELAVQVKYPHEILLFKKTAQNMANFLVALAMNLAIVLLMGVTPSWKIIFFPFAVLPLFFLATAFGLIFSLLSVISIDISKVTGMALTILMYLTPVIYSDQVANKVVQAIIRWNPLTYMVCSARDLILFGRLYEPVGFAVASFLSLLFFLVSWRVFYVSEDRIIERML